jgi:hypothetical protein
MPELLLILLLCWHQALNILAQASAMERSIKRWRKKLARVTGLEPATSGVTGRRSNRLSYTRMRSAPHSPLAAAVAVE